MSQKWSTHARAAQRVREWSEGVVSPKEVTLFLQHIPSDCTKIAFMRLIDNLGYQDSYDYLYLPRC